MKHILRLFFLNLHLNGVDFITVAWGKRTWQHTGCSLRSNTSFFLWIKACFWPQVFGFADESKWLWILQNWWDDCSPDAGVHHWQFPKFNSMKDRFYVFSTPFQCIFISTGIEFSGKWQDGTQEVTYKCILSQWLCNACSASTLN